MPDEHKTVFISYRRNVASFVARAIFLDLHFNDYDVFMDVESIDSGAFDTIILNQIEARAHFVLILTPGTLDRCVEPGDALRREIEYAIEKGRNIVPLFVNDFHFNDDTRKFLTGNIAGLPRFNGLNVPHDYFDEAMVRLRTRFLKQPVYGTLIPAPEGDHSEVQRKIGEVTAQPAPTAVELSAEEYFNRAYQEKETGDIDAAITDYTEALRLNPEFAHAYNNRGGARYSKGDLDGAIEDYTLSIEWKNPELHIPYVNRGLALKDKGDLDGAIADYDAALAISPNDADTYFNRGNAWLAKGELDNALADYDETLRLNPQHDSAYNSRGVTHYQQGASDAAIADFDQAIALNPQNADAFSNRGEAHFTAADYEAALADFREANSLQPGDSVILGGLAISNHVLGRKDEARRIWRVLLAQDQHYRDADWVGKQLNWHPALLDAVRKLIADV